ncbi:leucine-rich repeat domain-containing protein [Aeoliella sp.]|uniref:leucine-rich repeat domain-containing protein n=1 Tax=Aeoliella sp. TaxID=2795800 RepID=UPI003CCC01B2
MKLPASFVEYALSGELDDDATYTVERLIDRVRWKFEDDYWERKSSNDDPWEQAGYVPRIDHRLVGPAAEELEKQNWVNLQKSNSKERPIRDLAVFQFLPQLAELILSENQIGNLAPLAKCSALRRLHIAECQLTDISNLTLIKSLESLNIAHNPLTNLAALEQLPALQTLTLSVDQIPAFEALDELPSLRRLEFAYDDEKRFESFMSFPNMPELRVIWGAEVESLEGLERFAKLDNLTNFGGSCPSLEPISKLKHLTHVNILGSDVSDLWLLTGVTALRSFSLHTDCERMDLTPLKSLPKLHEVSIFCADEKLTESAALEATLSSWDEEFLAAEPRYTPSSRLEIVDQKTFDYFDAQARYGVGDDETNEQMLSSELEWLDARLEQVFSHLGEDDYIIPHTWPGGRSRTVVLYSPRAIAAFPTLVTCIQGILATAKNNWIIYFQSDRFEGGDEESPDFTVWVYPDKLQCVEGEESLVRNLLGAESEESLDS